MRNDQFYMISLTIVGILVPYDDENLINGGGSSDANQSPFVIAVRNAGIKAGKFFGKRKPSSTVLAH